MTKKILKTITVLMMAIFISCENDDNPSDFSGDKLENVSSETLSKEELQNSNNIVTVANKSSGLWRVLSYKGSVTIQNGNTIPHTGTIITTEGYHPGFLFWNVKGGFRITGSEYQQKVDIKRVNKNAGVIEYYYLKGDHVLKAIKKYIEIPPLVLPCPTSDLTQVRAFHLGARRPSVVSAMNYTIDYTFKWEVINNNSTKRYTNIHFVNLSQGESKVTLTVLNEGCPVLTNTQYYYSEF